MGTTIGDHAVVLGGSVAGLLAARVLSESYARVTVVERDPLPAVGGHRRGVPQSRHVHGLPPAGRAFFDEVFDGFTAELVAAGAVAGDELENARWLFSGQRLARMPSGRTGVFMSRPMLEGHLRARVRAIPTVTILDDCDVLGLTTTANRARVTGVHVLDRTAGSTARQLDTDLVMDATGRGSRTPVWLEQLGLPRPPQDRVEIGVCYATRIFRLRPDALGDDHLIVCGGTPEHPYGGALAVQEGGLHIVSTAGMLGERPPTELAAFRRYLARMPFPDIADAIRDAEPVGDPATYRYQANVRNRYERLKCFPAGLLVIGDAVCSFNPTYGQGMTAAALQARALRELLATGEPPAPRAYFRRIAKVLDVPWGMTVGADLANPAVVGKRTLAMRMANAYIPRFHLAAAEDPALALAFTRVSGLTDPPQTLLRVLTSQWNPHQDRVDRDRAGADRGLAARSRR